MAPLAIRAPFGRAGDWLGDRPFWMRLPAFGALGLLAAMGQVPASWPWAMPAALVVLFALFARGRAGFWEGWAFGAGHFAFALRWIENPFYVDPATVWMAPFALALCAAGFAAFWAVPFLLARRCRLGLLGLVGLWALMEAARSLLLTGFPWVLVGHAWIGSPIEQGVAWVGAQGLTLLTLAFAALLARLGPSPLSLAPLGALALAWVALDPGAAPPPDPAAPLVRIVQPNVPQAEKWDSSRMAEHLDRLMRLSGGQDRADLVVWPETALTEPLDDAGPTLAAAREATGGAALAFGVARSSGERWFNSLAVADPSGRVAEVYDKAHLVPFGEYVPWGDLLGRLGIAGLAQSHGDGFSPGPGARLLDVPGIGLVRPLICYESIFPEEVAAGGPRPRALLLVTNDAWFGLRAGPLQHLALGRLRAIEQGLPLVRAANTGVSAMVDGKGRVLAALPLREAGAIEARLPPALAPTLYAKTGDAPALLLALGLIAAAVLRRRVDAGVRPS